MKIRENISLKNYNSFGIDASARYYSSFCHVDELRELLQYRQRQAGQPVLILGGGSNILLTKDFDGFVFKNEIKGVDVAGETEDHIYLKTGAGENWHEFVRYCVDNNHAGVENLSLIPGCTGASPMQNIGAYGVEIKDVFHELEAMHIQEGRLQKFSLEDCRFGYRDSVFKNRYKGEYVITSVTYRLHKSPVFNTSYGAITQELENMGVKELSLRAVSQAVINIRTSKLPDPGVVGNAGSFFKNPQVTRQHFERIQADYPGMPFFPVDNHFIKVPAGWLIEQCGWKGYRKGDAGCYPRQALVLVNYGHASGKEIFDLSEAIYQSVKNKFAIALEREVNIL
jgi:UDP-N-acetylmuramate dehydrogenase